jgi:hypothetical protein
MVLAGFESGIEQELADKLITEALSWVGTPFAHQGKLKRVGVDCVHFIDVVGETIGLVGERIPSDYHPKEDGNLMLALLKKSQFKYQERRVTLEWVETGQRRAGDIAAFFDPASAEPGKPALGHLAIIVKVTQATTFIVEAGLEKVCHHRLNLAWMNKLHSCWRLRVHEQCT